MRAVSSIIMRMCTTDATFLCMWLPVFCIHTRKVPRQMPTFTVVLSFVRFEDSVREPVHGAEKQNASMSFDHVSSTDEISTSSHFLARRSSSRNCVCCPVTSTTARDLQKFTASWLVVAGA